MRHTARLEVIPNGICAVRKVETLHTAFLLRSKGMALVHWINLNLEGGEHAPAGQLKPMPASLGFLPFGSPAASLRASTHTQTPFGMTIAALL
jgi:hypothetical protein